MSTPTTTNIPLRTAGLYLLLSVLWIVLSDNLLALLVSPVDHPAAYARGQTLKGWAFVTATALFLYLILVGQLRQLHKEAAARRKVEQDLRALLLAMPLAVVEITPDGIVQYWNKPAEEMFGWTADEAMGQPMPFVPAENQEESAVLRQRVMAGESFIGVELRRTRKDGSPIDVSLSTAPVRGNGGEIVGILGIVADITERKQAEAEIRQLNAELERRVAERTAQLEAKNKELETFAYSVSHDLKAPLRGIDGYGRLLQEEYAAALDDEGQTFLNNIRQATWQMGQLIDDLLLYSRLERQAVRRVPIQLAALVNDLLVEQQEAIAAGSIELKRINLDVNLRADPDALSMALRNLLDNALKFTKETPSPVIEIGCRQTEDQNRLWVRDNGIGFEMQFADRIFDIFQRLHRAEHYPGTGIGLALARKAAQRMGGVAWAESEPGQGATFYLQIPNRVSE